MVLGPGTHVEEPVLSNGTLEVPIDFVKNIMDCRTGFHGMTTEFYKIQQFSRKFEPKVMARSHGTEGGV